MNPRFLLAAALAAGLSLPVLGQSAGGATPTPSSNAGELPGERVQEPAPAEPTPAEKIAQLERDKERLEREIRYARERAANARKALLSRMRSPDPSYRAIDAGTDRPAATAFTPPPRRFARVATAQELEGQADGTMLTVDGEPIMQAQFDAVMDYLRSTPNSGDDTLRSQRALYDLIRLVGIANQFNETDVETRLADAMGQLANGTPIEDVVKVHGTVQTASPEGRVEVMHNSVLGPVFEQIAFGTEPGQTTRPFRGLYGYVLLKVDQLEKGTGPEFDKVIGTALQVAYTTEQTLINRALMAINGAQLDIVVRDQQVLDMLPAMFRQMPTPVGPRSSTDPRSASLQAQLEDLQQDMQRLRERGGEEAGAELEALKKRYDQLRAELQKLSESVDSGEQMDGTAPQRRNDAERPKAEGSGTEPVKKGSSDQPQRQG